MSRPRRPRSHELETESIRAFQAVLPSAWVVRPVEGDYGVDLEVEVFDDESATGLTFKVQLKGTDSDGSKVRIKRSSLNYWRELDVPVLLVLYSATDKTLRWRWTHSIGSDTPDTAAERLTVHMDNSTLDTSWCRDLPSQLRVLRELQRGVVPTPVPVRVEVEDTARVGWSASLLLSELLSLAAGPRQLLRAASAEPAVIVTFHPAGVRARLPLDWASANLILEGENSALSDMPRHDLVESALLLLAAAISPVDLSVAGQLAARGDSGAMVWRTPEVAARLSTALAAQDHVELLFTLFSRLSVEVDPPTRESAEIYLSHLLSRVGDVDEAAFATFGAAAEALLEDESDSDPLEAGRRSYNLGHLYKARGDHVSTARCFERAASLQPRYQDDSEFHRHLGGVMWELGRYGDSAEAYRKALDLGFNDAELKPLLADSLMYAGEYGRARIVLDSWEPTGLFGDRVGSLRRFMLRVVADWVSVTAQARRPVPEEVVERAVGEGAESIAEVLRTWDALDPRLWLAMVGHVERDRFSEPVTMAAALVERSVGLWVLSLLEALESGTDLAVVDAVVDSALFHCGDDFLRAAMAAADEQSPENGTYLRELVAGRYTSPRNPPGTKVRWVSSMSTGPWVIDEMQLVSD